ncbi:MAG: class I SAM-dependent methyltransferase [bacterium]|nr:class I SAM-dependent methyltransferase [bacterium]
MKQALDYCFQLNPLLNKLYSTLIKYLKFLVGTRWDERYWAKRHLRKEEKGDWGGDPDWIKEYWDSRSHPYRNFLIQKLSGFSPIMNILEVGCNCGPNLYLLAKKFPNSEIKGIDINPLAVRRGNEWLIQDGISNVELLVSKIDELDQFQDKSFDIVFTSSVLMYIGPDKIKKVIRELVRITRKTLILSEWHSFEFSSLGSHMLYWVRDYVSLLKEFIKEEPINIIKMPVEIWQENSNWQKYGTIIEVIMEDGDVT